MKYVLFLAPSVSYASTVVKNLVSDMQKHKIWYEAGGTKFRTGEVEVKFICDDPTKWRFDGYRFDEIYGKKELVETFARLCPGRIVNSNKKTSLSRYVINQSTEQRDKDCNAVTDNGMYIPDIKKVHFNYPHTIVLWADGTKTMVKCQEGDLYDNHVGLAMAISKKALGNSGNYYNTFKKHLPDPKECEKEDTNA